MINLLYKEFYFIYLLVDKNNYISKSEVNKINLVIIKFFLIYLKVKSNKKYLIILLNFP